MVPNVMETHSLENFLERWMVGQQHYLDQLVLVIEEQNNEEQHVRALIDRVLAHYQQYYQAKHEAAEEDVFLMFSAPWFTPYERTFLWITGFKPSLLFQLVEKSVNDLSEAQEGRMVRLRLKTRCAEGEMNNMHARVQESISMASLVKMSMRDYGGDVVNGEEFRILRERMKDLVENVDLVRMATARDIVEILSPAQAVRFLVAVAQLQKKIRLGGEERQRNA